MSERRKGEEGEANRHRHANAPHLVDGTDSPTAAELALPAVTIAEIAFGIGKIRPGQRAACLEQGLASWRHRFADRIFPFTEAAALAYGDIMSAALRQGRPITAPDGMIAAIARLNSGRLATRNLPDFETTGLDFISPCDF